MMPLIERSSAYWQTLKDKLRDLAQTPRAKQYLFGVSAAESVFFPIPPDIMLIPMVLAAPKQAFYLAYLTTLASVLGAVVGYWIGFSFFDWWVLGWIEKQGMLHWYQSAAALFADYGAWAMIIAGITPIPFKIFVLAAGAMMMPLPSFIIATIIGRILRFFTVALIVKHYGVWTQLLCQRYLKPLLLVAVLLGCVLWLYGCGMMNTHSTYRAPVEIAQTQNPPQASWSASPWVCPTQGRLQQKLLPSEQGPVIFLGKKNDPIYAFGDGEVVYSGNGLPGYGELIIITHKKENILSVYAHNNARWVEEGALVKAGQHIADKGDNGSGNALLHFELRREGTVISALPYLPQLAQGGCYVQKNSFFNRRRG